LHGLLEFAKPSRNRAWGGLDDDDCKRLNKPLPKLKPDKVHLLQQRFQDSDILLIDEVSMVGPIMLAHVSQRLCEAFNTTAPFGGLAVVLVGDFFQLPPTVPPTPIYKPVIHHALSETEPPPTCSLKLYDPGSPAYIGTHLFSQFRMLRLTIQKRAELDTRHTAIVDQLRDLTREHQIDTAVLRHLKPLTRGDAEADPSWLFAPIIVTSNIERAAINMDQARRFALAHGEPVLRWPTHVTGHSALALSDTQLRQLYDHNPALHTVFVRGAPAYLTANINTMKNLCNGSRAFLHSISFDSNVTEQQRRDIQRAINAAQPGEVVDIPVIPLSVNVQIPYDTDLHGPWPANQTLVPTELVIPVLETGDGEHVDHVLGPFDNFDLYTIEHGVELGFAITFHKVQGRTLQKIILDLNKRPFNPPVTYTGFYVGVSRVKLSDNMRILPPQPGGDFSHLLNLHPSLELRAWLSGFAVDSGVWSAETACATFNRHMAQPAKKRASRTGDGGAQPAPAKRARKP